MVFARARRAVACYRLAARSRDGKGPVSSKAGLIEISNVTRSDMPSNTIFKDRARAREDDVDEGA
jgi:hypothetical protein